MARIYLDYCAAAPLKPAARVAMFAAADVVGNPSSVHGCGRAARRVLEDARESVAAVVGAAPAGVIFTAGGTEADNLALRGFPERRLIVSAIEHDAVSAAAGADAVRIPADSAGVIELAALESLLRADPRPALVSVMAVNNETGVIQPVRAAAELAHAYGALFHCDAAQAVGRIPVDMSDLGCDLMTLSGHKIGGPAGIGALIVGAAAPEALTDLAPQALIRGGGQERGVRAGTQNLIGAVGFAAAAACVGEDLARADFLRGLRDGVEAELTAAVCDLIVAGAAAPRAAVVTCLVLPGLSGEQQVMRLDLAGISVSAGAACSSGKVRPSHVLAAMGFSAALAASAVRVSFGAATTADEARRFVDAYAACCAGRRRTV